MTSWNHSGAVVVVGASSSALASRAGDRGPRRSAPPPRGATVRDGLPAWTSVLVVLAVLAWLRWAWACRARACGRGSTSTLSSGLRLRSRRGLLARFYRAGP